MGSHRILAAETHSSPKIRRVFDRRERVPYRGNRLCLRNSWLRPARLEQRRDCIADKPDLPGGNPCLGGAGGQPCPRL